VQAGVLTKEIHEAVAKEGFCVTVSNSNSVGVIPCVLAGGNSPISAIHGLAIDNLVSARIVTATNGLVTASEQENLDLFWALKGAGQFFGVVTEIILKIYPLNSLGRDDGKLWSWTFIFDLSQINDFVKALDAVASDTKTASSGIGLIMAPPPHFKPILMAVGQAFGSEQDARSTFAPFINSKPLNTVSELIPFNEVANGTNNMSRRGGIKYWNSTGVQTVSPQAMKKSINLWLELEEKCPGARATVVGVLWTGRRKIQEAIEESSAYGHRDVCGWGFALPNAGDEMSAAVAAGYADKVVAVFQEGQDSGEIAAWANHTRSRPIEQQFRGVARLARLRELKKQWDPKGLFPMTLR